MLKGQKKDTSDERGQEEKYEYKNKMKSFPPYRSKLKLRWRYRWKYGYSSQQLLGKKKKRNYGCKVHRTARRFLRGVIGNFISVVRILFLHVQYMYLYLPRAQLYIYPYLTYKYVHVHVHEPPNPRSNFTYRYYSTYGVGTINTPKSTSVHM